MSREDRTSGSRRGESYAGSGRSQQPMPRYFLPESAGVSREVMFHRIRYQLGNEAHSRFGEHNGERGHIYTAQREFTGAEIEDLQRWTELHDRDPEEYSRTCGVLYRNASNRSSQQLPQDPNPFLGQASGHTNSHYDANQFALDFTGDRRNEAVPGSMRPESDARGGSHMAYPSRYVEETQDRISGRGQPENCRQEPGNQPAPQYLDQNRFDRGYMRGQASNEPDQPFSGNPMQYAPNFSVYGRARSTQEAWTGEPAYRGNYPAHPVLPVQDSYPAQGYASTLSGFSPMDPYTSNARRGYEPNTSEAYYEDRPQSNRSVLREGTLGPRTAPPGDTGISHPVYGSEYPSAGTTRDGISRTKVKKESKP